MPVTVRIPAPLRPVTGGASAVECAPGTVRELIDQLDAQHAGFRDRVMEDGALRRFVNVFVAGEDVRFAEGIETAGDRGPGGHDPPGRRRGLTAPELRVALVTGGSGLVGRALVARLRADGVRVLATARTLAAERGRHGGRRRAPAHRRREPRRAGAARPPMPRSSSTWPCRASTRLCAAAAAAGAAARGGGRHGPRRARGRPPGGDALQRLLYGDAAASRQCDDDPAAGRPPAVAAAARRRRARPRARRPRASCGCPGCTARRASPRDLIVGLRVRRHRIVGPGDNLWSMLGADDAAAALLAAARRPARGLQRGRGGRSRPSSRWSRRSARCPGTAAPTTSRRRSRRCRWAGR